MDTIKALQEMVKIENRYGAAFRMALSHLMHCGIQNFTEDNVVTTKDAIDKQHDEYEAQNKIHIMTREFEKGLIDCAYELAQIPLWDLLLYIRKYVEIYDPSTQNEDDWDEE